MPLKLKRLNRQTIVITGGSFGIGLTIARRAAAQGARVPRNEDALRKVTDEIARNGLMRDGFRRNGGFRQRQLTSG